MGTVQSFYQFLESPSHSLRNWRSTIVGIMLWQVSFVVVLVAIFMGLSSWNQIDYERLCQVSCIEAEVNKYRVDPWDVQLLQSQLCAMKGITKCSNKFSLDNESDQNKQGYRLCLKHETEEYLKHETDNCFYIDLAVKQTNDIRKEWEKVSNKKTFFEILNYDLSRYIENGIPKLLQNSNKIKSNLHSWNQMIKQYSFLDFLEPQKWVNDISFLVCDEEKMARNLTLKEYRNLITLLLIRVNTDFEKNQVILHTPVFDQTETKLSHGTHQSALFSTCMNIFSVVIVYYLLHNFILSLLGPRKLFHFDPYKIPYSTQNLYRPDLLCMGSNAMNIFTSYSWQGIISDLGSTYSVLFVFLLCLLWITNILALFSDESLSILKLFPIIKLPYFFIFIIPLCLVLMNTSIFIFFSFGIVLSVFIPIFVFFDLLPVNLPSLPEIFCFFTLFGALSSILFFFWIRKNLVKCLNVQSVIKIFFWPTWPAQILIFVSLKARTRFGIPSSLLFAVWILFLMVCFFLSFNDMPVKDIVKGFDAGKDGYITVTTTVTLDNPFRDIHTTESMVSILRSYIYLKARIICFWLFQAIFILLSWQPFSHNWNSRISEIFLALCMTFFGVYCFKTIFVVVMYFVLKEVRPDSSLLTIWLPIILHLTTYLLEVWRSNYNMYETYLKSVISYIKSVDIDGKVKNDKRMENKDGVLVYKDRGKGTLCIDDDKIIVKGILLFIRDGKCYVPGDFFFKVIALQGGPGSIKSVFIKEIWDLFLRVFPAVFIFWVRDTIHLMENENYDTMLRAIVNSTLLSLYKGLFLHRKAKSFDVRENNAMQVQIDQFVKEYVSWAFLSDD